MSSRALAEFPSKDLAAALDLSNTLVRSLDGEIFFWSAGCESLYGWTALEALERQSHLLLQTSFPEPLESINASLMKEGSWSGNLLHRTKEGRSIHVSSHWVLQRNLDLSISKVIETNICGDGGHSHLAALVDSTSDAVIGETLAGIVTSWNFGAECLFKYTASEMVGRPVTALFPPELANEETKLIGRIRSGDRVRHYETVRIGKSGSRLDVSLSLSPIYDSAGHLVGISKIARDITADKARKHALAMATERLRLAAEAGEVGLWSLHLGDMLLDWTDRHKILFGIETTAPTPSLDEFLQYVHPQDEPLVRAAFHQVADSRHELSVDYRIIRGDASLRWITTTGKLHEHSIVLGTSIDITARRVNEESLRRLNASLEEFAFAAAHDLQEPLRNISLLLQELVHTSQEISEKERLDIMTVAYENSNRMQTLIKDLLTFSRALDSDDREIGWIDPNDAMVAVMENLFMKIEENRAWIVVDSILPAVAMHRSHLLQLFQNLVGNAIKYRSADSPVIHVNARQERSQVVFSVADNGRGISPEHHQRVFGVFKRLDHSLPGTGIGLAVCKRIVEHYNGAIWVESAVGTGSTFYFSIPYSRKQGK